MTQVTINDSGGLVVQQNSFTAPDGACETLENFVCTRDSFAIKRRGFKTLSSAVTGSNALVEYLETIFLSTASQIGSVNTSSGAVSYLTDSSSLWVINPRSKPRFAQASGNLYAATASGVLKIESTTASLMKAGIPRGLDLSATLSTNAGILAPDAQVGYRVLFGRQDANTNKVVGAPSEMAVITNSMNRNKVASNVGTTVTVTSTAHGLSVGNTIVIKNPETSSGGAISNVSGTWTVATTADANTFTFATTVAASGGTLAELDWGVYKKPTLNFTVPADALSTEYFYRIYRGSQSSSDTTEPEEDLQLIYEANLTSTNVSNKYVDFEDTVDDIFKDAYLYTNPNTGQGILQGNEAPPFARDVCAFKDMLFLANTQTKYTLSLALVSVSSLTSYTIGVTAGGVTRSYTGAGSEDATLRQYKVTSGSTTAANIDATARSLCKMINRDATTVSGQVGSQIYAYYVSGVDDVPGKMVLVSKSFATSFSLTVSNAAITGNFQPTLPTSGTTVAGTNASSPHAVYVSKLGEPEAVPSVNYLYVGSKSADILRIVPLRDSVLVLKEDGVYAIRGDSPSTLSVQPLDTTVICKAADSVRVVDNQCYFVSSQGVVAASETGVSVVGRAIEPLISAVIGSTYFAQLTTAVGYESERLYLLTTIEPNTSPETLSQTAVSASLTSNVVTLVLSTTVSSSQAEVSDTIILSGFTGGLSGLNGNYVISGISGTQVTFPLIASNIASTLATGSETISVIKQNVCYCYNIVTGRWSTWTTLFRDALVLSSDDKLYLLSKAGTVQQERKNGNKLDYCENDYALTIGTVAADDLSCTASAPDTTIEIGDVFVISDTAVRISSITQVGASTVYYFDNPVSFSDGATGRVYKYIESTLILAPLTAGDVSRWKHFSEFVATFRTISCTRADVAFTSNATAISDETAWEAEATGEGWGNRPWGNHAWGLEQGLNLVLGTEPNEPLRVMVPRECARATWIQARIVHAQAAESCDIQSFSYRARAYGSRVAR